MSLILSGTDGLSDIDGSAATPAIRGTDADTGIFFPAADTIAFAEGGVEAMRIDSSGNVGIGTTSPTGISSYPTVDIKGASGGAIRLGSASVGSYVYTDAAGMTVGTSGAAPLNLFTNGTERARIDSSGNLLVGDTVTSAGAKLYVKSTGTSNSAARFYGSGLTDGNPTLYIDKPSTTTTTSQMFVGFSINAQSVGSGQINANGANAAAFGSFSDSRLKENIVDLPSQLDNIMALRPVEYDYIESEGGGHQIGFVAQEVQEIYPDLVGERADGMLTLTDLNKNDARLIKAVQEMKAIIDAQDSLIQSLTDRITALEGAQIV